MVVVLRLQLDLLAVYIGQSNQDVQVLAGLSDLGGLLLYQVRLISEKLPLPLE
jgi:hypothetical protein